MVLPREYSGVACSYTSAPGSGVIYVLVIRQQNSKVFIFKKEFINFHALSLTIIIL